MRKTGLFKSVYSLHVEGLPTYSVRGEERRGGMTREEGEGQDISASKCTFMPTCTYVQTVCAQLSVTFVL